MTGLQPPTADGEHWRHAPGYGPRTGPGGSFRGPGPAGFDQPASGRRRPVDIRNLAGGCAHLLPRAVGQRLPVADGQRRRHPAGRLPIGALVPRFPRTGLLAQPGILLSSERDPGLERHVPALTRSSTRPFGWLGFDPFLALQITMILLNLVGFSASSISSDWRSTPPCRLRSCARAFSPSRTPFGFTHHRRSFTESTWCPPSCWWTNRLAVAGRRVIRLGRRRWPQSPACCGPFCCIPPITLAGFPRWGWL